MANIAHIRIDGRLIHGQVCTQWVDKKGAKIIYIIDDYMVKDAFLTQICVMATPVGTTLEVISTEEAGKRWQNDTFGNEPMFVLFQTCEMALKAYKAGFKFPYLNFGTTLNRGAMIYSGVGAIKIKAEHLPKLEELSKDGVDIYFQETPTDVKKAWDNIKGNMFKEAGI